MFKILSIDGGIMLGVIPAHVLSLMEDRYRDQHFGKRLIDCFDLVAGTSTGGLIAACLTSHKPRGGPRTAAEVKELYYKRGRDIFPSKGWFGRVGAKLPIFRTTYRAKGINRVLSDTFGDVMLSQTQPPVLIPTYDSVRKAAYFFTSRDAQDETKDADWPLRDVCRATSAGPTFLPAHFVPERHYVFSDGGVFANNPTMCAYAEAIYKFEQQPSDIMILSLGTSTPHARDATNAPGQAPDPAQAYRKVPRSAFAGRHIKEIVQMFMDGNADTVSFQAEQLLDQRYLRIQPFDEHQRTQDAFSTDTRTLDDWCLLGEAAFEHQLSDLDDFMNALLNNIAPTSIDFKQ